MGLWGPVRRCGFVGPSEEAGVCRAQLGDVVVVRGAGQEGRFVAR